MEGEPTGGKIRVVLTRSEFESGADPAALIHERFVAALSDENEYDPDEVEHVDSDPRTDERIQDAFRDAKRKFGPRFLGKPRDKVTITVPYERPGSRTRMDREVEEDGE